MLIHVTQEHIDRGKPDYPDRCALALAIREAIGHKRASVGAYYAHVAHDETEHAESYVLPENALAFRAAFDNREPVQPFTFSLPLPLPEKQ